MSSLTAHNSNTGSSPPASKPSSKRATRATSPPIQAAASWNTSKRATLATAACASSIPSRWPSGYSSASLSISCLAASRLPSTRSANKANASRSISKPWRRKRPLIHCGKACVVTALASSTTAFCDSAVNHLPCICVRSSLGNITITTVSSGKRSASFCKASPPVLPGLPFGMWISISFKSANKPMLLAAANNSSQSKLLSAV